MTEADLPIFFEQQSDPDANRAAAFMSRDPADRGAFDRHWAEIVRDPGVTIRTIVCARRVVGNIACFGRADEREVTYWIERQSWGQGSYRIGSAARASPPSRALT